MLGPNMCGSSVWNMLPVTRLEFCGGAKIFVKFVHPCSISYHLIFFFNLQLHLSLHKLVQD